MSQTENPQYDDWLLGPRRVARAIVSSASRISFEGPGIRDIAISGTDGPVVNA